MPRMPVYVAKAFKEGWARSFNQMLQLDYPPGELKFKITPKLREAYWLCYGWNYGQMLDPDGISHYSADFKFIWKQSGIKTFKDYMVPSMMDFTYPVFLIVTKGDPVVTIAVNDTGATQTIDFTTFIARFDGKAEFDKWSKWFDKRYGISPLKTWKEKVGLEKLKEVFGE